LDRQAIADRRSPVSSLLTSPEIPGTGRNPKLEGEDCILLCCLAIHWHGSTSVTRPKTRKKLTSLGNRRSILLSYAANLKRCISLLAHVDGGKRVNLH
jgi:hypothetical protein